MRDYYRILQVQRNAHPEVVRAAFRTLLKSLGKHPDLGGETADARAIIEAYQTLADPERRRAYDLWLQAHSKRPPEPERPRLAPGIANWIHAVLPEYRDAPEAPFGGRFDLALVTPRLFRGYLYVKAFSELSRPGWQWTVTVSRAIRLVRAGVLPTNDAILVVTPGAGEGPRPVPEAEPGDDARRAWNRCVIGVLTVFPPVLDLSRIDRAPDALVRLGGRLATLDLSRLAGPMRADSAPARRPGA